MSKLRRTGESVDYCPSERENDARWDVLPVEILAEIFSYVVAGENSALCLIKLAKVCRCWKSVADMPHLWTRLCFTPANIPSELKFLKNFTLFKEFASRFGKVHTLVCSGLERTTLKIVQEVSERSNRIKSFSLLQCRTPPGSIRTGLKTLGDRHGKSIEVFVLRNVDYHARTLMNCLLAFGERLTALEAIPEHNISYDGIRGNFDHLTNLTVLKLRGEPRFDLGFLKNLQRLRIVYITESSFDANDCEKMRWPELEDFDLSCLESSARVDTMETNANILQLLKRSPKVRRVSLRGRDLDIVTLCNVLGLCNDLEHLDVTVRKQFDAPDSTIGSLLHNIGSSLKTLYLNDSVGLDELLQCSRAHPEYWQHITDLSMESTNIKAGTMKFLLQNCLKNVSKLNLCRCRDLPRGCKRKWTDTTRLRKILEKCE